VVDLVFLRFLMTLSRYAYLWPTIRSRRGNGGALNWSAGSSQEPLDQSGDGVSLDEFTAVLKTQFGGM
jgi:hypothetical protein